jgi:hypothetical protein
MPILRSRRTSRPTTPRERRQSPRLTKRELRQSLSGPARKWVNQVWEAAERFSDQLEQLSPVTSPAGTTLIDEYMAEHKLEGEELRRALILTLGAGYSTRVVLVEPTEQPGLDPRSLEVDELGDRVRVIATDKFDSVMTLPSEVWKGYVATATMKQQQRLASKTLPWYGLGRERVELMLRWGYVLRCVDEALDYGPVSQDTAQ